MFRSCYLCHPSVHVHPPLYCKHTVRVSAKLGIISCTSCVLRDLLFRFSIVIAAGSFLQYVFRPNWASSAVQVVFLRDLLFRFSIEIAAGSFFQFVFRPNWASSGVQVVLLRDLLFRFVIIIAAGSFLCS
jgi:hypothetical protein